MDPADQLAKDEGPVKPSGKNMIKCKKCKNMYDSNNNKKGCVTCKETAKTGF